MNTSKTALVCVAGGSGQRFGKDKLAEPLAGSTVLETSLRALVTAFPDSMLLVVLPETTIEWWRPVLAVSFPGIRLITGGCRRQDSVRNGVEAALEDGAEVVGIHDGARPAVDPSDVRRVVEGLGRADGAVLCADVVDTVKRVNENGRIVKTVPREDLRVAQTPQVFRVSSLRTGWVKGDFDEDWTDEAALLESLEMNVLAVPAHHPNPKLTTERDLWQLEFLLEERKRHTS